MPSMTNNTTSRRRFMKNSAAVGIGLSAASASASMTASPSTDTQGKGALSEKSKKMLRDFGVKYPIIQAAPGGADLAIAVANAGGMGAVSLGWSSPDSAFDTVTKMNAATHGNYYANYVLHFDPVSLDMALEAGCPTVQFSWGIPNPIVVSKIRAARARLGIQVSSKLGAQKALELNPDFLIAQGLEAGGHVQATSSLSDALMEILELADTVPVIASGGISTGHDIRRVLNAGASAAILGTRFMATKESNAHDAYKAALVKAGDDDTTYTNCFNRDWDAMHRVLRNDTFLNWEAEGCPLKGDKPGEDDIVATHPQMGGVTRYSIMYPVAGHEGTVEDQAMYAGKGVQDIDDAPSAGELIKRLWSDFKN